jgi:hypothetical protein
MNRGGKIIPLATDEATTKFIFMDSEAPEEDNLETFLDSEEPDEIVIDGNADYCDDLARLEETIHQIWREQGFTDDEIANWDENERRDRARAALPLIKPEPR